MSSINSQSANEPVFLLDEIREEAGYAAAEDVEGWDEFMRERDERERQKAEDGPTQNIPPGDNP